MSPAWRDDSSDASSSQQSSPTTECTSCCESSPGGSPHCAEKPFRLRIHLASCKYPVLRLVAVKQLGWQEVDDEGAHLFWTDTSAGTERLVNLRRPQRLNHFPGMLEIARKKGLARNLANMRAMFPQAYDFSPRTFLLPEMAEAFAAELAGNKGTRDKQTYIIKLDNGSQGRGIKLVQTPAQAAAVLPTFEHGNLVACQYVRNPLLISGLKFDLRLYVLVRCCAPLRVFLCREGLVRLCTEPFSPPAPDNLDHVYAHLTNYAVNKHNAAFQFNQDAAEAGAGSKWTLTAFAEWMGRQGHDFEALWGQIKQLVAKTLIAAQPMLQYSYDSVRKPDDDGLTCFELLGFDVLIDDTLRPWLLEVNHAPSLTTDTPLDLAVKARLIRETLELAGVRPERVQAELAAKERAKQARLYNAHAASMAHSSGSGFGSSSSTAGLATQQREAAGAPPASSSSAAAPGTAAVESGCQPATPTAAAAALGPGAEPERGSAEWLAAQQAWEDAHLGQFERVMPPPDPQLAAQYEELLGGALQIFYRTTMQGRNQQRLNEIRERRQQECAQEAARLEAQQRRAENLRQWMAALCQRHREEREARAAAAAAEAAGGLDGSQAGCDGSSLAGSGDSRSSGSGSASSDGATADAVAVLQQYLVSARRALPTPLCASLGGGSGRPQQAQQAKGAAWGSGGSGQATLAQRGGKLGEAAGRDPSCCGLSVTGVSAAAAAGCSDSARTSLAGTVQNASCCVGGSSGSSGGTSSGGKSPSSRRPLSAGPRSSRPEPVTVEAVIVQRQAAAAAAGSADRAGCAPPRSPVRQASLSGSAALAAWQVASWQQSAASVASSPEGRAGQPAGQPWQQAAWDAYGRPPGACPSPTSSRFLDRVATFVGAQQEAQLAAAAQLAEPSAAGAHSLGGGGSSGCQLGDSAGGSLCPSGSGGGGSSSGGPTPELSSAAAALEATYLPPAMLSALHTVRMTPRLLSGLCPPPPPAGAVQQRRASRPGRQAPPADEAGATAAPARGSGSGRVGQAAFVLPPTPGARQPPAARQHPQAARHVSEARGSPVKAQPGGSRGSPRVTAACGGSSSRGGEAGKAAGCSDGSGRLVYREAIQQQAVKSVADLIAGMIKEQNL